jgi:hypothetical protein
MTIKVILAPSADIALNIEADVTIEAEYGSVVAEGSVYTAAHHQAGMEDNPAPCNDKDIPALDSGTILLSHVDLDSFGGALRAMGVTSLFADQYASFWNLAEFVDTNGPHKLGESGATDEDILRLHAFWAWKRGAIGRYDTDKATDVTETVVQACDALAFILTGDEAHLEAGRTMMTETQALNETTFERVVGDVVVRVTDDESGFCNHLYTAPTGEGFAAVAAYNKDGGTITISLAEAVTNVSCRDIMQNLFGPEAGGHEGIAGSPREQHMTYHEFTQAHDTLRSAIETSKGG